MSNIAVVPEKLCKEVSQISGLTTTQATTVYPPICFFSRFNYTKRLSNAGEKWDVLAKGFFHFENEMKTSERTYSS